MTDRYEICEETGLNIGSFEWTLHWLNAMDDIIEEDRKLIINPPPRHDMGALSGEVPKWKWSKGE